MGVWCAMYIHQRYSHCSELARPPHQDAGDFVWLTIPALHSLSAVCKCLCAIECCCIC